MSKANKIETNLRIMEPTTQAVFLFYPKALLKCPPKPFFEVGDSNSRLKLGKQLLHFRKYRIIGYS